MARKMNSTGDQLPFETAPTARREASEHVLLHDVSDAVCILSMGSEGISAGTVALLRARLLASVSELAARWTETP
jgi:hypothetical protein